MESRKQTAQQQTEQAPAGRDADTSDEAQSAGKSDFGAFWILIVVVVMAGSTLWMIRDAWTARPLAPGASQADVPDVVSDSGAAGVSAMPVPGEPLAPAPGGVEQADMVPGGQSEFETLKRQKQENLSAIQQEARRVERERLEAEQQLEAERAARVALERERLAAQRKLEAERQARLALEEQRRRAEQKLARERAARAALEQEAQREREKLSRARQQAEQAAREQAVVEASRQTTQPAAPVQPRAAAAQALPVDGPNETPLARASAEPVSEPPADAGSVGDNASGETATFSSNPCTGPSAKFLSTCR